MARGGYGFAAAERRSDGAFVGMVGIQPLELDLPFCPCVEIGWRLQRAHWGQGYATEAAGAWLDYGFDVLGLAEIVAFTDRDNHRSLAVMRRLGMSPRPVAGLRFPGVPRGGSTPGGAYAPHDPSHVASACAGEVR